MAPVAVVIVVRGGAERDLLEQPRLDLLQELAVGRGAWFYVVCVWSCLAGSVCVMMRGLCVRVTQRLYTHSPTHPPTNGLVARAGEAGEARRAGLAPPPEEGEDLGHLFCDFWVCFGGGAGRGDWWVGG